MLGLDVLEDGLDDDVGMRRAGAVGIGNQPVHDRAQRQLVLDAPGEAFAGALECRGDAFEILILQRHRHAAQRAPGGNVAAHDAGADDVDAFAP